MGFLGRDSKEEFTGAVLVNLFLATIFKFSFVNYSYEKQLYIKPSLFTFKIQ